MASWLSAGASWAAVLLMVINLVCMWLMTRSRASKDDLALRDEKHQQLATTVADLDKRASVMEEAIKHIPTQEDLSKLTVSVTKIEGSLESFTVATDSMARAVDRIQDFLLNGGAK